MDMSLTYLPLDVHAGLLGGADLSQVVQYAGYGLIWNVAGYVSSASKTGERIDPTKTARTVLLGAVTGAVLLLINPNGALTPGALESAQPLAVVVADTLWNAGRNVLLQIRHNQFESWGDWQQNGTPPGSDPPASTAPDESTETSESDDRDADPTAASDDTPVDRIDEDDAYFEAELELDEAADE